MGLSKLIKTTVVFVKCCFIVFYCGETLLNYSFELIALGKTSL